jgi:hypothetical protein
LELLASLKFLFVAWRVQTVLASQLEGLIDATKHGLTSLTRVAEKVTDRFNCHILGLDAHLLTFQVLHESLKERQSVELYISLNVLRDISDKTAGKTISHFIRLIWASDRLYQVILDLRNQGLESILN